MSEVEARPQPTRGRGSGRGGRGGFTSRGQRGTRKPVNGTTHESAAAVSDEPGEIGDMKRKYQGELPMLKDMFQDWTDVDLLFALQECDGDLPATVDRITQGSVSQFSEVKSAKDRARSRVKDEPVATSDKAGTVARGTRGRGDGTRGRGGRGTERGRGGQRGGRGGHATINGAAKDASAVSVPTTESSAWNTESAADATLDPSKAGDAQTAAKTRAPSGEAPAKKTWASMFSAPPKPAPAPKSSASTQSTAKDPNLNAQDLLLTPNDPAQPIITTPTAIVNEATQPAILAAGIIDGRGTVEEAAIPPPKDPLTAENVEHLPDASNPPATHTAASTVGSNDPRNLTPLPGQQTPSELGGRPALGGFQTSAFRAASGALRSSSYQRRVQEQHEAVVMPGHNAVDRAAVQFGSMGLNGEPGPDVDDEREDPETRQAHQHSPPSQPKASLPPVPRQTAAPVEQPSLPEAVSTKQAPGLPPASQQNQPPQQDAGLQNLQQDHSQHAYAQNQYSGYGQSGVQQDNHAAHQKPYDPFAYQTQQQHQYDRYGAQNQNQQQAQQQHSGFGGLSSASHDYSAYYTSQQRDAFNQYYGSSGNYNADNRQHNQQQDVLSGQRAASGYGNVSSESAYGGQSQQQTQPRYGDSANSGHNTPNPHASQQHSAPNAQQSGSGLHQQPQQQQQQQQQQHHQQNAYGGAASGFPYGHPYFNSPYQQAYQNQFGYPQYGGASYSNKAGGMYGSPHGYNLGSQSSFDQHGSGSNTAPYNQQQQSTTRNASGVSSGIAGSGADEYGRGSAQGGSQQAGSGYGAINDPFARAPSGFNQGGYGGQTTSAGQEDGLKAYGDNKAAAASPALGQPGRPGSAANNPPSTSQSGLPPAQNQQSGYGGYQGYPGQSSQYGSLGGLGGHQQQGQNAQGSYGSYNAGGFGQYGGGYNSRGGWGQSYGAH